MAEDHGYPVELPDEATPLLPKLSNHHRPKKLSSKKKTFGNIIISIIGAGVLGLPYAFKESGYLLGSVCIVAAGALAWYCMMLLIKCAAKLKEQNHEVHTYGDLGFHSLGNFGRQLTDVTVVISQGGCCVAYLVFIAENLCTLVPLPKTPVILLLIPFQTLLSWIRSLTGLAPFSIVADVFMAVAMAVVIKDDVAVIGRSSFGHLHAFTSLGKAPFVIGVAVYCFEGFAMTQPIEQSMKERRSFGWVLGLAITLITFVYLSFGMIGYMAYGEATKDIITLNLPHDWTTVAVKLGLSVGLFFTFPVMMVPVYEIADRRLMSFSWFHRYVDPSPRLRTALFRTVRALIVVLAAYIAISVPGFGIFISLVGSTVCAMLAFVLPALFHLKTFEGELSWYVRAFDYLLIAFGATFGVVGTYNTLASMFEAHRGG